MGQRSFNAGAALAFLDEVSARFGPSRFLSIEAAWDAAWIVCMTPDARHEAKAETALAEFMIEMNRLSSSQIPALASNPTV